MKIKAYAIIDINREENQQSDFFYSDPTTKLCYMPSEADYENTDYILPKTKEDAEEKADFINSNTARDVEVKEVEVIIKLKYSTFTF